MNKKNLIAVHFSVMSGVYVVRARAQEGTLRICLAALTLQCEGTESPALVDPQRDGLHGVSEGECELSLHPHQTTVCFLLKVREETDFISSDISQKFS